jgi:RNA polymerase sigma-B factor
VARIGFLDPAFAVAEERIELGRAMRSLSERERRIVLLRFFGGLTQREIAERIGISQMHVSRLLRRALERMGEPLAPAA